MEVGALLLPPAMVAEALTPAAVALLRESPVQLSIQARTEPGAPAPLHPAFDLKRTRRSVSRWRPGSSAATGCRRGVRQQAGRDVRGGGAGRGAGRGRPRARRAVGRLRPGRRAHGAGPARAPALAARRGACAPSRVTASLEHAARLRRCVTAPTPAAASRPRWRATPRLRRPAPSSPCWTRTSWRPASCQARRVPPAALGACGARSPDAGDRAPPGIQVECAAGGDARHQVALCFLHAGIYQVYAHNLSVLLGADACTRGVGVSPLYVSVAEAA